MFNKTQNNQTMKSNIAYFIGLLLFIMAYSSCKKSEQLAEDPYAGGKEALGIRFLNELPKPTSGSIGSEMTFAVSGLLPYKDKLKCYMNETEAEVVEVTGKTIKIKLPEGSSSGGFTIVVDGQIFFGPQFTVSGKIGYDGTFKPAIGPNGNISQIMPLANGNMILVGSFNDYEKKASLKRPINNIVLINSDGDYLPSFASGLGSDGSLNTIARLTNGQYMIGGSLSSYNNRKSIGGLTRLNSNGSLDTTIVEVVNLTPLLPKNSFDTVAAFNGRVIGSVRKLFVYNNKSILIGNFTNYGEYFYERSTRDRKVIGYTPMDMLMRLESNGKLDESYNFNAATKTSYEKPNGSINDAFMEPDGKVILVGSFTRFQGTGVNRITRVDNNGMIDPTFQVGSGADGPIGTIRFNVTTQKYMVSGAFKTFNGKAANGMVMLKKDGSVDESFNMGTMEGGSISFSAQLSNGLVIVTGSFNKYNGVIRQGFMVLNPNGTLADGYNTTGVFQGIVNDIYETTSPQGFPAFIMAGFILKFDNRAVPNIIKVVYAP
ncbi:protein of unknown function [Pedobacter nyackensis]|uniref:DUF5008 domain-containing protein n=2 Tax=Pedobacter nyackensis TaxID=475255 RepID=A0A1W2E645_9SPHI|nr:protein of unknown function [Pedobacter nyackensis]